MWGIKRSTIKLFVVWLLIVPPGSIYLYSTYPPTEVNWLSIAFFIVFGFLTVRFPIIRNGTPVFLVLWLTIPAFLLYGIFTEMIIMQIALLATLFNTSNKNPISIRFYLNSLVFFFLSISAAWVFRLVGGEIGSDEFWPLILAVFCYQVAHMVFNDIFIKLVAIYKKNSSPLFTKEMIFDYGMIFVILPLSLTQYYLLQFVGIGSFLLLGIPFFFIILVIRLYSNSETINESLQKAGDIGHGLSDMLTEKAVIDRFVIEVADMFDSSFSYLFDHVEGWLEPIRVYKHQTFIDIEFDQMVSGQGIAGLVLEKNQPIIYSKKAEWELIGKGTAQDSIESVLCVPISRNKKVESVLLLASEKINAFDDYQLQILDLLCSYFAVAVEKARYMQEAVTRSERCALTKIYNYRFLEEKLIYEMDKLQKDMITNLSVIMLDIDHFKNVNDTYGHQSGNDILYQLARKLEDLLPTGATVGRYGGEEFVYILPNMSKEMTMEFAERLRAEISQSGFLITPDLGDDKQQLEVTITLSIGVSSAPEDTDEAMSLLRNADRALYTGAKHAGRNRVASYVK
ncbi:sensor domain-containing diguanylate cyclase [Filibacter tadaridae]|uniref:Putative diguanylate cyclase YedQ n=1 Tax=Filibacter tadaridae TaxID=2483811 RepID=A0A3P5XLS0_9BACL|nr:sensor domain-containing diguanylate cyclase [Filibacter tadaridae]VDC32634.1 putative diguanylate cyclase YedQ [Filibacter tadaridae]